MEWGNKDAVFVPNRSEAFFAMVTDIILQLFPILLFLANCSSQVFVELNGGAQNKQRVSVGLYKKKTHSGYGTETIWINDDDKAIWFASGKWRIGDLDYVGTTTSRLYSTSSPACPENPETQWEYYDGENWSDAPVGDALIKV